jgi:hypothetical protein
MIPAEVTRWDERGARTTTSAQRAGHFLIRHVLPLLYRQTVQGPNVRPTTELSSEEQFWGEAGNVVFEGVRLKGFRLSDWFPRAPGVYWSRRGREAREQVESVPANSDGVLGKYFLPQTKMDLVEGGGIGTIRLRPRSIDGEDCWLATALSGAHCHSGIPLAIPHALLRVASVSWGERVNIEGRVRFLQDAGLDQIAAGVQGARPLIVFVDAIKGQKAKRTEEPIIIAPVALFAPAQSHTGSSYDNAQYAFVQCEAGRDGDLDTAVEWIERYASKFSGRLITNFDEQRPVLAGAPLSYQRLVAKTYDRALIQQFAGTIHVERIDSVMQQSVTSIAEVHVGHNISVAGPAIINIDSTLSNVTQTIGSAPGLDAAQKSELDALVNSLKQDLDSVKVHHADEAKEIADALEKAVANAAKPVEERKQNLLQLSAKGLKEAAELVRDTAPSILTTAGMIAKFISSL